MLFLCMLCEHPSINNIINYELFSFHGLYDTHHLPINDYRLSNNYYQELESPPSTAPYVKETPAVFW